jgi:Schlafen, AlbA_2
MGLEEWNMDVLDDLLQYREIERDNFDFKSKELGDIDEDVCALANTITGVLCLGIKDPRSTSPNAVFTKDGFRVGTEDARIASIMNYVAKVEPIPRVTYLVLADPDKQHYYVILKVEGSEYERPYMVKDTGTIFVRIGGSTRPASRTTIANLFINLLERRNSVRKLRSHCSLLRNELILTSEVISTVDENYLGIIPLLDLNAFKDAVLSAEWFLSDQDILGQVNLSGSTIGGMYVNLQELNVLNTTIDVLNKEQMNRPVRYQMSKPVLDKWKDNRNEFKNIIHFLEDIVRRCGEFLQLNG